MPVVSGNRKSADPAAGALDVARRVIADEAAALGRLAAALDDGFAETLQTLRQAAEPLIVTGLGKSGIIAHKISASLTSTGTQARFLHPVEALHGDLGIVTAGHCLVALSRSGNTEEVVRFAMHFRRCGGTVVAMTQGGASRLAELARHTIALPEEPEAGPLNLAPTTSCVQMLAAGDALAMALLHTRGFGPEDFARSHPEGSLGKRLLLRAADLMHAGEALPLVREDASFRELMIEMNAKALGLAMIVDAAGGLLGTFTDGDLRRVFLRVDDTKPLTARQAHAASRRDPDLPAVPISTVPPANPAVDCLRIMLTEQITSLVVVDESGHPVGLLRERDLLNEGLG
jgi:arabinose-5-phosphate isomerase